MLFAQATRQRECAADAGPARIDGVGAVVGGVRFHSVVEAGLEVPQ